MMHLMIKVSESFPSLSGPIPCHVTHRLHEILAFGMQMPLPGDLLASPPIILKYSIAGLDRGT